MSFGWEVREVFRSRGPFKFEMAHVDAVLDPVISHVNRLAAFNFSGTVGDSASWRVIIGDDSW